MTAKQSSVLAKADKEISQTEESINPAPFVGCASRQNLFADKRCGVKSALSTLLSLKKLLAFLGKNSQILAILLIFSFAWPALAHAGFFSNFIKFFNGGNGDDSSKEERVSAISMSILSAKAAPSEFRSEDDGFLYTTQDSSLVSPLNPLGTISDNFSRDRIILYRVQEGDTPSSIAKSFDISLNTLLWANNLKSPNLIKVGDELVILPVSGVKYEIKRGDTIDSIAKKFKGDRDEILEFNGLAIDGSLAVGTEIIIPDGEASLPVPSPSPVLRGLSSLPEYIGYYLRPILGGRNSRTTKNNPRGIHGNNGVDLASACGAPVLASAPGQVIVAKTYNYNVKFGYGNYVVINHPNGTQTLYGHLSKILVASGQAVERGNALGLIGSSGNSTGCHVHFEIRGARNPF